MNFRSRRTRSLSWTVAAGLLLASGVVFLAATAPSSSAAATELPWLKTSGNRIVSAADGREVVLRGANVLRSEWDLRMDAERRGIPALAGQWGGNVILRGFASNPVNAGDAAYLAMLDEHVALAKTHRMYVIFAWRSHTINGPQPQMPDDGAQRALAALAKRYHGVSHVMYALQVEPHDVTWDQVQPRFVQMVDAIRGAAAPHKPIVMVPGTSWGRDVSGAISRPVQRENVVYKSHQYNDKSDFARYFLTAHDAGLPVFLGEFGYAPHELDMDMDDVQTLMDLARQRGIGWAAWVFDFQGGPELVTDNISWNPTSPYGVAVKKEMLSTPAIPVPSPPAAPSIAPPVAPPVPPTGPAAGSGSVNDTAFTYSTGWTRSSGSAAKHGGNDSYSDVAGATATLRFRGTAVTLYGSRAPWHGIATVSVDGGAETVVDYYGAARRDNVAVWARGGMTPGEHVLTVRVRGTRSPASTGNVVTVDRAVVRSLKRVNDNVVGAGLHQFTYAGSSAGGWSYASGDAAKYAGDDHYSAAAGATARIRFRGTSIALYGSRAPWHGSAAVSIDGGPETYVDFYGAARQDKVRLFSRAVAAGEHVLTIRVRGTRRAASTGNVVTVDRVDVGS